MILPKGGILLTLMSSLNPSYIRTWRLTLSGVATSRSCIDFLCVFPSSYKFMYLFLNAILLRISAFSGYAYSEEFVVELLLSSLMILDNWILSFHGSLEHARWCDALILTSLPASGINVLVFIKLLEIVSDRGSLRRFRCGSFAPFILPAKLSGNRLFRTISSIDP